MTLWSASGKQLELFSVLTLLLHLLPGEYLTLLLIYVLYEIETGKKREVDLVCSSWHVSEFRQHSLHWFLAIRLRKEGKAKGSSWVGVTAPTPPIRGVLVCVRAVAHYRAKDKVGNPHWLYHQECGTITTKTRILRCSVMNSRWR